MKTEARLTALERVANSQPRPLAVLFGLIERGEVESLSDAELERVAASRPDLSFLSDLSDEALDALVNPDGFEAVKALDSLTTEQLRGAFIDPTEAELERLLSAEQERLRRLRGEQHSKTACTAREGQAPGPRGGRSYVHHY